MHQHPRHAVSRSGGMPVRAWLQPVLIALVIVSVFIGCYIGFRRDPQPHGLPIAVSGSRLPEQVQHGLGDAVDVHTVDTPADARLALDRHDVVGALSRSHAGAVLPLDVAGADGALGPQWHPAHCCDGFGA
ncbi:hypothetical protein [Streptomyces sp. NPDC093984]|uniref:hypothetical protein n=1 Tax=Streptomyces sp. NPDC093984 TaxID=3366052 RepID=UPI0038108059